jgi:uncharacterized membrane protein
MYLTPKYLNIIINILTGAAWAAVLFLFITGFTSVHSNIFFKLLNGFVYSLFGLFFVVLIEAIYRVFKIYEYQQKELRKLRELVKNLD